MKERRRGSPSQSEPLPKRRRATIQTTVSSSESNNQPSNRHMSKRKSSWSEINTNHFLNILLGCKRDCNGLYNGKNITNLFLEDVAKKMKGLAQITFSVSQVREKHRRMKKDWALFSTLIKIDGVGWNPDDNRLNVSTAKILELKQQNPRFKKFLTKKSLNKGFPRYADMNELWLEAEASGAFARGCNNAPLSSDDEQELLNNEFQTGEASSQPCENYGKSKRRGKSQFDPRMMSSSPYSRSLSGKSGAHSSKNGSHSTTGNNISIKEQALQVYIYRCSSKAEADVWSLGRCLDEINSMKEIKDSEGHTPHQIMMDATAYFEDNTSKREAFMHWPHDTRSLLICGQLEIPTITINIISVMCCFKHLLCGNG